MPCVAATLDHKNPREWYYALMDYGAMLGKTLGRTARAKNPNIQSAHYQRQSKFHGSLREVRGKILKLCVAQKDISFQNLLKILDTSHKKIKSALHALLKDEMVVMRKNIISLP